MTWRQTIQLPEQQPAQDVSQQPDAGGCTCSDVTFVVAEPEVSTQFGYFCATGSICPDTIWNVNTSWEADQEGGDPPTVTQVGATCWQVDFGPSTGTVLQGTITANGTYMCGGVTLTTNDVSINSTSLPGYRAYRLVVTANGGGDWVQLAAMFLSLTSGAETETDPDEAFTFAFGNQSLDPTNDAPAFVFDSTRAGLPSVAHIYASDGISFPPQDYPVIVGYDFGFLNHRRRLQLGAASLVATDSDMTSVPGTYPSDFTIEGCKGDPNDPEAVWDILVTVTGETWAPTGDIVLKEYVLTPP